MSCLTDEAINDELASPPEKNYSNDNDNDHDEDDADDDKAHSFRERRLTYSRHHVLSDNAAAAVAELLADGDFSDEDENDEEEGRGMKIAAEVASAVAVAAEEKDYEEATVAANNSEKRKLDDMVDNELQEEEGQDEDDEQPQQKKIKITLRASKKSKSKPSPSHHEQQAQQQQKYLPSRYVKSDYYSCANPVPLESQLYLYVVYYCVQYIMVQ